MLAICFLLGLGAGAYWFRSAARSDTPPAMFQSSEVEGLSPATLALLQRLNSPVEIRFYALIKDTQGTAELNAFATRVAALLAEYERAGGGRIVVKRIETKSSAAADGIEPVGFRRGELDYLGLALDSGGQKAVIPRLSPDWETALESDLSRAIARVTGGGSAGALVINPTPTETASTQELLQTMPEVESLTLDEAAAKLRARGLEEFKVAATEMQAQLLAAQQRLAVAQQEGSDAEATARKQLQQLQSDQSARLGEISQRMQNNLAAVRQLKRTQQ